MHKVFNQSECLKIMRGVNLRLKLFIGSATRMAPLNIFGAHLVHTSQLFSHRLHCQNVFRSNVKYS